jgi:hypothetical protein
MKSIKRTMQFGALAIIAGAAVYQCSAVNVGGEDDRRSTVSVFGRGNQDEDGSLVRVGGLKVLGGNGEVVGYEGKKSRVCETGRSDARHNRTKSYFRESNNAEYERCKNDELDRMNAQGNQPTKRGRTASQNRRTRTMNDDQ